MHFLTRGGIADGEQQSNDKTVTLIEAELVPTITKVATPGSDGVVKGRAFEATGANLGFNFATDRVSVKWTEGGVTSQSTIVPISVTAEKIAFNSCALFADLPDGTALEFTFEVGGKVVTKSSEGRHRPVRADRVLQGLDPHGAVQAGEGVISG